jgi:hypothetical protein
VNHNEQKLRAIDKKYAITDNGGKDPWHLVGSVATAEQADHVKFDLKANDLSVPVSDINNLLFIFKDILEGDPAALQRPEFQALNIDAIIDALNWLMNSPMPDGMRELLMTETWRVSFKPIKYPDGHIGGPPSMEDFLTDFFIGPMADSLYEPLKKALCKFWDPLNPARTLCLCACIGWGKSTGVLLSNLFCSTHLALMYYPWRYFGLAPSTIFTNVLCGSSQKAASQLLSEPFGQFLEQCKFFRKVRSHDAMIASDLEFEKQNIVDHLSWTTATPTALTLDTEVLMHDNTYKPMGDVHVGDLIYAPSYKYKSATVDRIPFEGLADCFEIELENGDTAQCSAEHLWKVFFNGSWEIVNTQYMIGHPDIEFRISVRVPSKYSSSLTWDRTKIKSISLIGKQLQKCIHIDSPDGLFVIKSKTSENNIITHNSSLQISNNQNYKLISSANSLLGQNICHGSLTEIGFMKEAPGWTDDKILHLFNKLRGRITSRMKGSYYGRMILDSSPNTLEDGITTWIFEEAPKSKLNQVETGSRWLYFPEEFPKFLPDGNPAHEVHNMEVAFPFYKGGKGKAAAVLDNESQLEMYDPNDIVWCPKEVISNNGISSHLELAKENPVNYMKDYIGIPTAVQDRIFYDPNIIEAAFDNKLKNIYGCLDCPALEDPEHLIWDQVKNLFFYKVFDRYQYYYQPNVPRVLSVDQAITQDMASVSVSHVEYDPLVIDSHTQQPSICYVTDFVVYISPKGGLINLDAIKFFIQDLRRLGNMNIRYHSFDGFEARTTRQYLDRAAFVNEYLSVDKDNTPYMSYINAVFDKRWHCGKNIFLKNNMKSLYMAKRKTTGSVKVDHFVGDLVYEFQGPNQWNTDRAGYFAKDGTDCVAGNIALLNKYANEFIPYVEWKTETSEGRTVENITKAIGAFMNKYNLTT